MKKLILSTLLIAASASAGETPGLNIDPNRITVSGISSGAHMAHQLHIAYSDLFSGAALLSGGPYGCARNSLMTAMGECMAAEAPPAAADLLATIRSAADEGKLADTANLADDRVWLFHGSSDTTISQAVHDGAAAIYAEFVPEAQIRRVNDVPAGHFFPTDGRGHACDAMEAPYVGDCGYDAAGELLGWLYGDMSAPSEELGSGLQTVTLPGADDADLSETAYLFVPAACAEGQSCALHLALHGCAQSAEQVGAGFIEQSGYLEWAESNGIVMAFPQVEPSMVAPLNPHACWDWWGYTSDDYLNRNGPQMRVLADWVAALAR